MKMKSRKHIRGKKLLLQAILSLILFVGANSVPFKNKAEYIQQYHRLEASIGNSQIQKSASSQQTPANKRITLLPILKAAKILGALYFLKSFNKNPLFRFDFDIPATVQDPYYENTPSYKYPAPPPEYPPYYKPQPPPSNKQPSYPPPQQYSSYNHENPYSEEMDDECDDGWEDKSKEADGSCEQCNDSKERSFKNK